ncbi:MAG TPA: TetR/AcrR family transcriptional regulator [Candidatus Dormibacteraeota bacterium]|jgi:AcrR family transcriptional regulator|nr:TetR/AcrR family transcriptional regulator [Candidatus Dormibacteraeota bacterium]
MAQRYRTIVAMAATTPPARARRSATEGRVYRGQSAVERQEERRQRLIEAGLDLFATQGYLATSIEEICAAAAISTRNFYEQVDGREGLLMLLHDIAMQRAQQAVLDSLGDAPQDDVSERIRATLSAFVQAMTDDPRWARIAYVEVVGISAAVERRRHMWMNRFAKLMAAEADAIADRGLAPRRDHELAAVALVGAIDRLIVHWQAGTRRRVPAQRLVDELARMVVATLSAP